MKNINTWLENFKKYWLNKEIDLVMDLFTDDVQYYENPFLEFKNNNKIKEAWKYINKQDISLLEFEVFSKEDNKFTIKWNLEYTITKEKYIFKGIYLMSLNNENKCNYFIQYGEKFNN